MRAIITSIDEGVARVAVGDAEEEWFFPLATIPTGEVEAHVGLNLWLERDGTRYVVLGVTPDRANPGIRGFGERLDRLHTDRRELWALQPVQP